MIQNKLPSIYLMRYFTLFITVIVSSCTTQSLDIPMDFEFGGDDDEFTQDVFPKNLTYRLENFKNYYDSNNDPLIEKHDELYDNEAKYEVTFNTTAQKAVIKTTPSAAYKTKAVTYYQDKRAQERQAALQGITDQAEIDRINTEYDAKYKTEIEAIEAETPTYVNLTYKMSNSGFTINFYSDNGSTQAQPLRYKNLAIETLNQNAVIRYDYNKTQTQNPIAEDFIYNSSTADKKQAHRVEGFYLFAID